MVFFCLDLGLNGVGLIWGAELGQGEGCWAGDGAVGAGPGVMVARGWAWKMGSGDAGPMGQTGLRENWASQAPQAEIMGISRDSMHKRRATGGKKKAWRKKRKYELGRQPANTKLSSNKTAGTQTLVKGAIIQVDAAPFKQWYLQHYGVDIGRKKKTAAKKEGEETEAAGTEEVKKSNHVQRKLEKRQQDRKIDQHIEEQFGGGRLLAAISSRPGQCGRADGYILEGKELEFYMKKLQRKKGKGAGGA
ncbi:UNVERIFIED_CONTAM: 40S ribosomal protein S8 [Sesamum radiatum]|uniref:40S ribosomal protein S8 n=1 Tax=Sesamum radiatum TaxID=300843 RepID=A0AAW2IK54_SESRA